MPEGLKNAGSTFSWLTKTVLEGQVGRNIFKYVDDIVVASRSKEDHLADLAETFANMRDAQLRLNPENVSSAFARGKYWATWCHTAESRPTQPKFRPSST
jgi:hypothetical protein